jgi:hypothetical protein
MFVAVPPRRIAVLLAGVVLAMFVTRAARAETDARGAAAYRRETIGFELTPASMSLVQVPCCDTPGQIDRFQAGPGGGLRLFRHRWKHAYVIPFQVGVYASSWTNGTSYAQTQVEGGVILPWTDRRIEVGAGLGFGVLSMTYSQHCDGDCRRGDSGVLASAVIRGLFVAEPTWTMGASARVVIPTGWPDIPLLTYTSWGAAVIFGLEVGLAPGPSVTSPLPI